MPPLRSFESIRNRDVREILAGIDPRGGSAPFTIEEKRASALAAVGRAGAMDDVETVTQRSASGIPLRVYRPKRSPHEDLPWVLYIHGGGFFSGGLDTHEPPCRAIAKRTPAVVAAVDYRLAPEHPWPAALDDCRAALRWVLERTDSLGTARSRIVVAGDSAGGNLAACLAQEFPQLAGQVLVYPMLDGTLSLPAYVENALAPPFTLLDCVYAWQLYLPQAADRRLPSISPLHAEKLSGLPAALILTSEYDVLRDDGLAYAAALRGAGVAVETEHYEEMPHGFLLWGGTVPAAQHALDRIAAFVSALR